MVHLGPFPTSICQRRVFLFIRKKDFWSVYFIKKSQVIVAEKTKNHIQMKNQGHIPAPVAFDGFP